jgi:hypothetical protein
MLGKNMDGIAAPPGSFIRMRFKKLLLGCRTWMESLWAAAISNRYRVRR